MGLLDRFVRKDAVSRGGSKDLAQLLTGGKPSPPKQVREFLDSYGAQPWMRAVVSKIAYGEAAVRWKAMAAKETVPLPGGKGMRTHYIHTAIGKYPTQAWRTKAMASFKTEEFSDHPLVTLLASPCPMFPGLDVRALWSLYMEIVGEAFFVIERQGTMPIALYPLPPHWVKATPTPADPIFEIDSGTRRDKFDMTEILWDRDLAPVNPYGRGLGLMRTLDDELDASENASKLINYQFYNMNRPDLLVSLEGAKDDRLQAFKEKWTGALQGLRRAFRTFFVNEKVTVERIQTDFVHSQLGDMIRWLRDVVHQIPGVPPEMLGILDQSNRATITAAEYIFAQHVLVPRLEKRRAFLQHHVVPMFDERLLLEFESPVPRDKDQMLAAMTAAPIGTTVDDWRDVMGLPPMEDENVGKLFVVTNAAVFLVETLEDLLGKPEPEPKPMPFGGTPPGAQPPKPGEGEGEGTPAEGEPKPGEGEGEGGGGKPPKPPGPGEGKGYVMKGNGTVSKDRLAALLQ